MSTTTHLYHHPQTGEDYLIQTRGDGEDVTFWVIFPNATTPSPIGPFQTKMQAHEFVVDVPF